MLRSVFSITALFIIASKQQEHTATPIYVGLLLHGETRKRSLVDKFHDLGLSVSYDRVLSISADLGNDISEHYKSEGVVCPR